LEWTRQEERGAFPVVLGEGALVVSGSVAAELGLKTIRKGNAPVGILGTITVGS
jgi:hypothetical protein